MEFISEYASPFAFLVIADLLGVPEEDRADFLEDMQGRGASASWSAARRRTSSTTPWISCTPGSAATSRTVAARPRQDVLTGLATATFPDGSLPEVIDVVRVAVNLFAAGQETTVRLLGSALALIAERPDIQDEAAAASRT